jgi:methyl-accepting chemotaxis protein
MIRLSIGQRLGGGMLAVVALLGVMCAVGLWSTRQIRQAGERAALAQREAEQAQEDAARAKQWRARIDRGRTAHAAHLRRLSDALLNNEPIDSLVGEDAPDAVAELLNCEQMRGLRAADPSSCELLDQLNAGHAEFIEAAAGLGETWQVRHEGLAEALDDLQRTYMYWTLKVANLIFVQSMLGEIVPEEEQDTPLGRFMSGEIYQCYADDLPMLREAVERAKQEDLRLWEAAGELDMKALMSEWEEARKLYRDVFPPATKAIAVHLGDVLRVESVILERQVEARQMFREQVTPAADRITSMMDGVDQQLEILVSRCDERVEAAAGAVAEARADVSRKINLMDRLNMTITAAALALAGIIGWLLTRAITRPIRNISHRLRQIAQGDGDLTQRVTINRRDELGELARWFNCFVQNIHDVIAQVRGVAEEVVNSAGQIACFSEQAVRNTQQQHQQVEQISAVIGEMTQTISDVAHRSEEAAGTAAQAGQLAEDGGQIVHQSVAGMQSIGESVATASHRVEMLGRRSDEIGKVVAIIDEIADQTNLLALNAAIEAARAGAHGRGFGVVADEVRRLADRTSQATSEVNQVIRGIQDETRQTIEQMALGQRNADDGMDQARAAGDSLHAIVEAAREVAKRIEVIASAATEQSAAADQVRQSVSTIAEVAGQTHDGIRQTAEAVHRLNGRAADVQQLLARFKLGDVSPQRTRTTSGPNEDSSSETEWTDAFDPDTEEQDDEAVPDESKEALLSVDQD